MNYIIFEGPDGSGKTTLAKEFAKRINGEFTYEPLGEGEICSKLREFCLSGKYKDEVNWRAREYMMLANRAVSTKKIKEKLERGQVIVQDRSLISGMTFAKVASGIGFQKWWTTAKEAFWVFPQLVVYIHVDKQRIVAKGDDIYDNEKASFHKKIKQTFPDAIEFLKRKKPFESIVFENNFDLTPQENARDLAHAIHEHFGVTYH